MSIHSGPDSSVTSIGLHWTDEDLVLFLLSFRNDDPLPLNVIADKDPFIIEPWDAQASTWFLRKHADSGCAERQIIRLMRGGYWKEIENNTQISWDIIGEGRKVFWEFYVGHEPSGDRTGWQMLEYRIEQKEVQEADGKQESDFSSLCRIYLKEFDTPILEDACPHSNADQNTADCVPLATKFQVPSREEQGPRPGAGRCEKETGPDNNYSINGLFNCSSEDFLELKDFEDDHGSPSSSSDDCSCLSGTSDGCFDSVALLWELGCENDIPTESREANTCHSPGVNQVSIELPPTASSQSTGYNLLEEGVPSASAPTDRREVEISAASSSRCPQSNQSVASHSGEPSMGGLKRAASRVSEGPGSSNTSRGSSAGDASSHGSGRSVGRIKKLGKKYCCLSPFQGLLLC